MNIHRNLSNNSLNQFGVACACQNSGEHDHVAYIDVASSANLGCKPYCVYPANYQMINVQEDINAITTQKRSSEQTKLDKQYFHQINFNSEEQIKNLESQLLTQLKSIVNQMQEKGLEITTDVKLTRLFENYIFCFEDLVLLERLAKIDHPSHLLHHLRIKISSDLIDDIGFDFNSIANWIAKRSEDNLQEAKCARIQYLMDLNASELSCSNLVEKVISIFGRPGGLRQDISILYRSLSSHKSLMIKSLFKVRSLRKFMKPYRDREYCSDLLILNKIASEIYRQLYAILWVQNHDTKLKLWPATYFMYTKMI